jgi:hypothetical protein
MAELVHNIFFSIGFYTFFFKLTANYVVCNPKLYNIFLQRK